MSDTDISELIMAEVAHAPDDDNGVIAQRLLVALKVNRRAAGILLPLVRDAVRIHRRLSTLRVERAAGMGRREVGDPVDMVLARKALSLEFFKIERNGDNIRWGAATVDQHRQRIEFLTKYRSGIDDTIRRHQAAIAAIEAADVTCLDEIEEVA